MKFEKFFRRGKKHYIEKHYIRSKLYKWVCKVVFSCDIPFETYIADDVEFCHNAFGIVINSESSIDSGTCIQHGVTIGERRYLKGAPKIGKNVFIGARAIILGDVQIGDYSKIGAVVLNDVPPGSTVVGVPAHVIEKKLEEE